jgi:integrase
MGKLTKAFVERERRQGRYGDGDGLVLEIGPTGAKSWTLRYQRNGRAHWMGLGSVKLLSLPEARERARLARLELLNGRDPLEARRAQQAEQAKVDAASKTFKECALAVIAARKAKWTNPESERQWSSTLEDYAFPAFGHLPVAAIDTALVLKAVEPLWARAQVTADRLRNRIEAVLDWATAKGYRTGDNPARWRGHLAHVLPDTHKVKNLDAMPYTEIPGFMATLRERQGMAARALEFTILTAVRSGDTLGAKWSEIESDVWTIPAERMKARKAHTVPLSPPAQAILAALPRVGDYVFASPRNPKRPMEKHAMREQLSGMGVTDCSVHGFRSSFSDWAADNTAFPQEVREQALAHTIPNKVEKSYRRGQLLEKRARLMGEWARYCATPAAPAGKVVPIRAQDFRRHHYVNVI